MVVDGTVFVAVYQLPQKSSQHPKKTVWVCMKNLNFET